MELVQEDVMVDDQDVFIGGAAITPEMKSRFISDAVHDLSTPLSVMRLRLDLLRRTPDQMPNHLAAMEYQIERMEALVKDLQVLSRLDLGIITTELRQVNLNEVASRVFAAHEPMAKRKNLTFLLDTERSLPEVMIDERQIERVMVNLVANAVNYTPTGGMVLVSTTHEENDVILTVADTGIGIEADEVPHIFERFFRGTGAQQLSEGTGLGLAIVRQIINNYGGKIAVQSTRYKGSRFTVHLPRWNPEL